jgi:hypothetical protein
MSEKLDRKKVKIFKIRNRTGYAAIYNRCITEGTTPGLAYDRMLKAIKRKPKSR